MLLKAAHDKLGQKGVFSVKVRLKDHFWWPRMEDDIRWYIRSCQECQLCQTTKIQIPPTVQPLAMLFEKAYVDVMHMPYADGFQYIIQARNLLTSYPEFCILCNKTAKAMASFLFEIVFCRWGTL